MFMLSHVCIVASALAFVSYLFPWATPHTLPLTPPLPPPLPLTPLTPLPPSPAPPYPSYALDTPHTLPQDTR